MKRYHSHITEYDGLVKKKAKEDSSSDGEYVLIWALTCTITHGIDVWLVDSGASNHMNMFKHHITHMTE